MAKLNIYVPEKLKERINNCDADISWSAVACKAFEAKLDELSGPRQKNVTKLLEEIDDRLKLLHEIEDKL